MYCQRICEDVEAKRQRPKIKEAKQTSENESGLGLTKTILKGTSKKIQKAGFHGSSSVFLHENTGV
jgi:hypothetical protein